MKTPNIYFLGEMSDRVMQSDRILACLLCIKLPSNFPKCPLKWMKHVAATPRYIKGRLSVSGRTKKAMASQTSSLEKHRQLLYSWHPVVMRSLHCSQCYCPGLAADGAEHHASTFPTEVSLQPEGWGIPHPPNASLEGNPQGDPNPWNSSSCGLLLSHIINCHGLCICCTSNGKNSTPLPSVECILSRNVDGLTVAWDLVGALWPCTHSRACPGPLAPCSQGASPSLREDPR